MATYVVDAERRDDVVGHVKVVADAGPVQGKLARENGPFYQPTEHHPNTSKCSHPIHGENELETGEERLPLLVSFKSQPRCQHTMAMGLPKSRIQFSSANTVQLSHWNWLDCGASCSLFLFILNS